MTCAEAQQAAHVMIPQAAVVDYCAAWNTTDRAERERLLARVTWTESVSMGVLLKWNALAKDADAGDHH
jgi:hypothetical protein